MYNTKKAISYIIIKTPELVKLNFLKKKIVSHQIRLVKTRRRGIKIIIVHRSIANIQNLYIMSQLNNGYYFITI